MMGIVDKALTDNDEGLVFGLQFLPLKVFVTNLDKSALGRIIANYFEMYVYM